ncbi:unnamed protein product, partial [Prorocentrum cordatum]
MVVAARIDWIRRRVLQGAHLHVSTCCSSLPGLSKIKLELISDGIRCSTMSQSVALESLAGVLRLAQQHTARDLMLMIGVMTEGPMTMVTIVLAVAVAVVLTFLPPLLILGSTLGATHGLRLRLKAVAIVHAKPHDDMVMAMQYRWQTSTEIEFPECDPDLEKLDAFAEYPHWMWKSVAEHLVWLFGGSLGFPGVYGIFGGVVFQSLETSGECGEERTDFIGTHCEGVASDAVEAAIAAAVRADMTLPKIANDILPTSASSASATTHQAATRSQRLEHILGTLDLSDRKDDAVLRQLYEVIDRLRVSAKDAQNYVDRSLALSHAFVPIIEGAYPCPGADAVVQDAHRLHLLIGRAKDVIGNPPGGDGGIAQDSQGDGPRQPLRGAADLLAEMERSVGAHAGGRPGGLHPMPLVGAGVEGAPLAAAFLGPAGAGPPRPRGAAGRPDARSRASARPRARARARPRAAAAAG